MNEQEQLRDCVKIFFEEYLNIREESDSGRIFSPITVSCCRAYKYEALNNLLERMRVLSGAQAPVDYNLK